MICGFWLSDLCILSFGFFFFFGENVWVCFTVYHLLGCFFFLDWVCFTFRIDVGLFCGLALLIFFFFFFQILVQIFFGLFFFFICF